MSDLVCKICIITKGLKGEQLKDATFESEDVIMDHIEDAHGIPVAREGETNEQAKERFKKKYPDKLLEDEMNQARVEYLTEHILEWVFSNMSAGPISRYRVYESLNALAVATATVIQGSEEPRVWTFFQDALKKNLDGVNKVRLKATQKVENPLPEPKQG